MMMLFAPFRAAFVFEVMQEFPFFPFWWWDEGLLHLGSHLAVYSFDTCATYVSSPYEGILCIGVSLFCMFVYMVTPTDSRLQLLNPLCELPVRNPNISS